MFCRLESKECPVCRKDSSFEFCQDFEKNNKQWTLYECNLCNVQFWVPFKNPGSFIYEEDVDYSPKKGILKPENAKLIVKDYWNMSQFIKHIPHKNPKEKKLLDVACGTGEFLSVVKDFGYDVTGVDFNAEAVRIAKESFYIPNVFSQDVTYFLKEHRENFDVITAFEIIEHLDNPYDFLQAIHDSLRKDGYIAISTPNRKRNWGKVSEKDYWDFPYQHLSRWDSQSFKKFLKKSGFEIIEFRNEIPLDFFMPYVRLCIQFLFGGATSESTLEGRPIEQMREKIGMKKFKKIKSFIRMCTAPIVYFMFYVLRCGGSEMYILGRKI